MDVLSEKCRYCWRNSSFIGGVCDGCFNAQFKDDGRATVQAVSKLLKLSTATLKRLEAKGELVAERNELGSRRYKKSDVEAYISATNRQLNARIIKEQQIVMDLDEIEGISFTTQYCQKCNEKEIFGAEYCESCTADLISKGEAANMLGITWRSVDRLTEKYPEILHEYPYKSQVRLSKQEFAEFTKLQPNIKSAIKPKWSDHFLQCRNCKKTDIAHYGAGYCEECYPETKEATVLQRYIDGENLSEVGESLGFSRERARQLFGRAIEIELARIDDGISEKTKDEIRKQIELSNKQNRSAKKFKHIIDEKYEKIVKQLTSEIVLSENAMLKSIGLPPSAIYVIEEEYPEFLEIISRNKHRWSWKYDQCRMCGTTQIKHKRWGYCEKCYTRSEEWKEQQYRYRQSNYEKFRERQKAYEAEYYKRPEVKKRMIEKSYHKRFDGKRESTIMKAGYRCEDCGINRDEHRLKFNQDLLVYHMDGNLKNNEQSNLKAFCRSCMSKNIASRVRPS